MTSQSEFLAVLWLRRSWEISEKSCSTRRRRRTSGFHSRVLVQISRHFLSRETRSGNMINMGWVGSYGLVAIENTNLWEQVDVTSFNPCHCGLQSSRILNWRCVAATKLHQLHQLSTFPSPNSRRNVAATCAATMSGAQEAHPGRREINGDIDRETNRKILGKWMESIQMKALPGCVSMACCDLNGLQGKIF